MSYRVCQENILAVEADAAVIGVEITLSIADSPACLTLAERGGEALRRALRKQKFLAAGSACALGDCGLPYRQLIAAGTPRWFTGKANELLVLRRCCESVYEQAEALGCRSLVMPFLSATYYRFPQEEAVHIALSEAEKHELETIFVAETPALLELSRRAYRKPRILSYVGYYRDHALFELDNGLFARVDLRPERTEVSVIPYFEACYRVGNNPLQTPLPEAEVARLREIYENYEW